MHSLFIPICIEMSGSWARSAIADVRPHGQMSRRRPKAHSSRPRSGGLEAFRGRRSDAHQGERIAFTPRLATKPLQAVQTALIASA